MSDPTTYPGPDYIEFPEAVRIVEGLVGWLRRAPEGVALQLEKEGEPTVTFVRDARRAGYVLQCIMETWGTA